MAIIVYIIIAEVDVAWFLVMMMYYWPVSTITIVIMDVPYLSSIMIIVMTVSVTVSMVSSILVAVVISVISVAVLSPLIVISAFSVRRLIAVSVVILVLSPSLRACTCCTTDYSYAYDQ